jgi:hypothetical protein
VSCSWQKFGVVSHIFFISNGAYMFHITINCCKTHIISAAEKGMAVPYTSAMETTSPETTPAPEPSATPCRARTLVAQVVAQPFAHAPGPVCRPGTLAAVMMFLAAIVAAFWYLRAEEAEREQEALRRDVEYAQQRVRLRLLERQEQLMRIARDISNQELERAQNL